MELKDYKDKVFKIMEEYPKARNNDLTLMAHYLKTYRSHLVKYDPEGVPYIELRDFKNMALPETLIRARRIIQNTDNTLLPTDPKVIKARRIKEQNYRDCEVREAVAPRKSYNDN